MNRLLLPIALLFGFVSLAAPIAAAPPHVPAAPVVVEIAGDACTQMRPVLPRPALKPCANKYKGGIAVFCHQFIAVLPASAAQTVPRRDGRSRGAWACAAATVWPVEPEYRPPRGRALPA